VLEMQKGTNNEDLSTMNRSLVIQYLKRNGVSSRAEISKAIGLTQASISKTMSILIKYGIVKEVGFIPGEKGRRSIGISLAEDNHKVIGVKLSRRSFSIGVFDIGGNLYDVRSENINEFHESQYIINRIKAAINEYLNKFESVAVIGIAVPGPYQRYQGKIALITEMNNWLDIELNEQFVNEYDIPVVIEHDANAGALAEWWFGSQCRNMEGTIVHFLVGEGVGTGILVNGNIFYGNQGIAGEIGHISVDINGTRCRCGNYGCLETYCSSIALVKLAEAMAKQHSDSILNKYYKLTVDNIFEAAKMNDQLALKLVNRVGKYIGYGIVNIVYAYDPSIIIISNSMSRGGRMILDAVNGVVKERLLVGVYKNLDIVISNFAADPVLYGAAAVAIDYFLKNPSILMDKSVNTYTEN
jgi:glucokinase-like ROK family protein